VRATTTAITAVAAGRRCFVVRTVEAAFTLAAKLDHPLLVGEQRGVMPEGFDINNSPAALIARDDLHRPAILLSSSGTRLCHEASACEAAYLACLRNCASVARHLAGRFANIAVIGAGTKGEFREEDQLCCAWVADILTDLGYQPDGRGTEEIIERWRGATPQDWVHGKSAAYLRGQLEDLEFILGHVNDLDALFALRGGEVIIESAAPRVAARVKERADAV
jgi:2-phosphosulfolactate phosphatase